MSTQSVSVMKIILTLIILMFCSYSVYAADGFGENATGGAGGPTVTVDNAADFEYYVESSSAYIIEVSGTIDLASVGGKVNIESDKTIRGVNSSATIIGQLGFQDDASNIIIEYLNITAPDGYGEGDGISIKDRITNVFINHCTIYDCADGCLDISNESDYITVSWCKFYYTFDSGHNFVNLIGSSDSHTQDRGKLHITFHHNWWSTLCRERMPRVRYGQVHVYNNYYSCTGNNYCIRPAIEAQILAENNYFDHVHSPIEEYDPTALVEAHNNVFDSCTGEINPGTDDVFTPPYSYSLDDPYDVPSIVMAGAGNVSGDTDPPAAPTGLSASGADGSVALNWDDNTEPDLAGYNVYRSNISGGEYTKLNSSLLADSDYIDDTVTNDNTYYYVVTAVDTSSNESAFSDEVSATPTDMTAPAEPTNLWAKLIGIDVAIDWADNTEPDLAGYNIYRATDDPCAIYVKLNAMLLSGSDYIDDTTESGHTYFYVVTAVDTHDNESADSQLMQVTIGQTGTGSILREWWTGISGSSVNDMTSSPNYPDSPDGMDYLANLEGPVNWMDSYGSRLRGYIHPPVSGDYTFWIASDDNSQLWLSSDGSPANATVVASVPGFTEPRQWDKYPEQQSTPIYLTAGRKYYIEILHKENSNDDHLAVAWQGPSLSQQIISGQYLSPWFVGLYGDFDYNETVDMNDLERFLGLWLEDDCILTADTDLDGDCNITFYEFAQLAWNWQFAEEDTTAPSAPTNLTATGGDGYVDLNWDDNSESDLAGYNVYRATSPGGDYTQINGSLVTESQYTDNTVTNGTTYYYVVTAVDTSTNESGFSNEASATPTGGTTSVTIQEETTGFCGVDGLIENEHSGYTGTGYANTDNAAGNGVDWSINVLSAGLYSFKWRYANGSSTNRLANLIINSSVEASNIDFPSTISWDSWSETATVEVNLSAGIKSVRLEATGGEGLANIDYIQITGPSVQVYTCP